MNHKTMSDVGTPKSHAIPYFILRPPSLIGPYTRVQFPFHARVQLLC